MRAEDRLNDFQVPLKVGYLWCLGNGLREKIDPHQRDVNGKKDDRCGLIVDVGRHGPEFLIPG